MTKKEISNMSDGDPIGLALKIDRILKKSGEDDETRRKAIEFVWFSHCGRLMNWSDVRIRKDLPQASTRKKRSRTSDSDSSELCRDRACTDE